MQAHLYEKVDIPSSFFPLIFEPYCQTSVSRLYVPTHGPLLIASVLVPLHTKYWQLSLPWYPEIPHMKHLLESVRRQLWITFCCPHLHTLQLSTLLAIQFQKIIMFSTKKQSYRPHRSLLLSEPYCQTSASWLYVPIHGPYSLPPVHIHGNWWYSKYKAWIRYRKEDLIMRWKQVIRKRKEGNMESQ